MTGAGIFKQRACLVTRSSAATRCH